VVSKRTDYHSKLLQGNPPLQTIQVHVTICTLHDGRGTAVSLKVYLVTKEHLLRLIVCPAWHGVIHMALCGLIHFTYNHQRCRT